ncbi:MAG: hypothetical protein JNK30_16700 [Phenylobacterium sp.]|uniref:hypothetical protein n=1 Tax=Phenylobacterium sp. TaxID=1871053 RepID=UPI001A3D5FEF|nr:hypothetical protein [Phenylobacterium sp.]MBL8773024.1 hypothetical protein [Phenylobacterium sp.]
MPQGEIYNHETVLMDGETFSDCEFRDCRLVYGGGEPPAFAGCSFVGCDWKYEDAAARTLAFLKLVWSVGGKAPVQALIKDITAVGR